MSVCLRSQPALHLQHAAAPPRWVLAAVGTPRPTDSARPTDWAVRRGTERHY